MAGITLAQAETQLAAWLAASAATALNQSYRIADRQLTRADAAEILGQVKFWDDRVKSLSRTRGRTKYVVPE